VEERGFSVGQRRVVVVGAARSGIAAAMLLAKRGAMVTLSEMRDAIDDADALRSAGVALELGGHRPETFAAADLVVLSGNFLTVSDDQLGQLESVMTIVGGNVVYEAPGR